METNFWKIDVVIQRLHTRSAVLLTSWGFWTKLCLDCVQIVYEYLNIEYNNQAYYHDRDGISLC